MNKYWFKKYGKGGAFPVTWEGWAYFAFVIGLVTQTNNILGRLIEVGALEAALVAGLVAAIGFYGMRFKTNPTENYDKIKDKGTYKQLWGALIGMLLFFVITFGIGQIIIQYQHSSIGYPVRIDGENTWFEFHAIKDDFVIQVPSYPKYSVSSIPIPNTSDTFNIATYDTKKTNLGNFVVIMAVLPASDSFDVDNGLNGGMESYKADMAKQTGEEPKVIKSERTTFQGYPAVDFILEGTNSDYRLHAIYVIGNGRMFGLTYGREKESFSDADFKRFSDSFKFENVKSKS